MVTHASTGRCREDLPTVCAPGMSANCLEWDRIVWVGKEGRSGQAKRASRGEGTTNTRPPCCPCTHSNGIHLADIPDRENYGLFLTHREQPRRDLIVQERSGRAITQRHAPRRKMG
ncbi:hypothetical protein COCON_G00092170 [Conger conger]|uniref:Uncharacterized protein n=1 Tax=Conger conger TaxID=82655 RepID=A0A9Q1DL58_CONCO|nr:hypothetical protein COCON_G00092170 [Conger conger]